MTSTRPTAAELATPDPAFARGLLLFLAVSNLTLGIGNWSVTYLQLPGVWAAFYFVAAGACVYQAARISSRMGAAIAGSMTGLAHAARAGAITISWATGYGEFEGWGLVISLCTSITLTGLVLFIFVRGIAPLAAIYRREGL